MIDDDGLCGDCLSGRCHWGGEQSRQSEAAAERGEDAPPSGEAPCGCDRHAASVKARTQ